MVSIQLRRAMTKTFQHDCCQTIEKFWFNQLSSPINFFLPFNPEIFFSPLQFKGKKNVAVNNKSWTAGVDWSIFIASLLATSLFYEMEFVNFFLRVKTYLKFGGTAFIADEEKIRLAVDRDLLFESAAFWRLFLHVGAGEVTVDQRRFTRRQRPDNAQTQVRHRSRKRPFLTIHERICFLKRKKKTNWKLNTLSEMNRRTLKGSLVLSFNRWIDSKSIERKLLREKAE